MAVVLEEVAVHALASSVTVSACTLIACCFHVIIIFSLISMYIKNDSLIRPCVGEFSAGKTLEGLV